MINRSDASLYYSQTYWSIVAAEKIFAASLQEEVKNRFTHTWKKPLKLLSEDTLQQHTSSVTAESAADVPINGKKKESLLARFCKAVQQGALSIKRLFVPSKKCRLF